VADPVVAGKSFVVVCSEVQLEANQQVARRSFTVAGFTRGTNFEAAVENIDPMDTEVVDSVG